MIRLTVGLIALLLIACAAPAPVPEVKNFPLVTRRECGQIAEAYRTHRWTAHEANIMHGLDAKGIRVDTPDSTYQKPGAIPGWWRTGVPNQGVPYQWGGFSTLA